MKRMVIFFILSVTLYSSEIKVAIASNINFVIKDLVKEFNKKNPHIKISTILGSSGKLSSQIIHNAPFDIFLCANMKYAQKLYELGFTLSAPEVYAKGNIILLSLKKRDFSSLENLFLSKEIKKIAIANPKTAPYGEASKESLKNMKIYKKIESKLVYAQSISQTLFYTTKITDLGIVAKSSLFEPSLQKFKQNINWIEIPQSLYKPIKQGIVLIKKSKNKTLAKKFYDFVLSFEGKKIFKSYGYSI